MTDDDLALFRLLGLPRDTDVAHLRYAYEQHVADAVRSHNHVRALQLSRAFDALGTDAKRSVYSGAGTRAPRFATNETRRQRPAVRFRSVAALVAVPALFVAVGAFALSRTNHPPTAQQPVFIGSTSTPAALSSVPARTLPPVVPATRVAATPTVTPMPGEVVLPGDEFLRVPLDWPTRSDGGIYLACDAPAGVGLTLEARPGNVLQCPLGSHLVRY